MFWWRHMSCCRNLKLKLKKNVTPVSGLWMFERHVTWLARRWWCVSFDVICAEICMSETQVTSLWNSRYVTWKKTCDVTLKSMRRHWSGLMCMLQRQMTSSLWRQCRSAIPARTLLARCCPSFRDTLERHVRHYILVVQVDISGYTRNAWNDVWCPDKCGEARYVKHCISA